MARQKTVRPRRVLLNAGAGPPDDSRLPPFFRGWRQIRVDIDPDLKPDLVANIIDLRAIPDGTVDAIWSAHCLEHLFAHQVPMALAEFRRVLRDRGFACIIVPDLQAIGHWIANDQLEETIYHSAAGPVTAHDMLWGFGLAIAAGKVAMAHHCGFTPAWFLHHLKAAGFPEIVLRRRRSKLELAALALQRPSADSEHRAKLLTALGL
jgi:SAM-dependent methyltransferase